VRCSASWAVMVMADPGSRCGWERSALWSLRDAHQAARFRKLRRSEWPCSVSIASG
jgi:hypothetical protein